MDQAERCRLITSVNKKGGVGKTHLCFLIASVCQELGKRCLVVDLDPQANFTSSFLNELAAKNSVAQLFDPAEEPDVTQLIHRTSYEFIDVVPASAQLQQFNENDSSVWWESGLHLSLREALADVQHLYDYILFDCPPSLSLVTFAALTASDFVIIPLEAAHWGALGTREVRAAIRTVQQRSNEDLQLLGYVASRFKTRRAYQQTYLSQLRNHVGGDAFATVIPDLAAFEKAVTDRIPLTLHSPKSHAADIARTLFTEIETRCERLTPVSRAIRS